LITTNRTRASAHAFFAWCLKQGLVESNPVVGTERSSERPRSRILSDVELKAIWATTADASDYSAVVRLLMLTGQRASEIAALKWSEISGDQIVLPAERTKNKREHRIPITAPVAVILDSRPRRTGRDFIFGRRWGSPLTGWSVSKAALDARLGKAVKPWTHHDLRRTAATTMADRLAVAPHIIEAVLNHVSGHKGGVAGVYNLAAYEIPKRQALTLWAEHLLSVVGERPATVVPMRA
jgi:integrase